MTRYVLNLSDVDQTQIALAGGKGAHLGALSRIAGIHVPAGFCVTTTAYEQVVAQAPSLDDCLEQLSQLRAGDREGIRALSARIRALIEAAKIPVDVEAAIVDQLDEHTAYAVRSSATAEDLPNASFAGQQDTYLNVIGHVAILQHISQCWASLFTERAIAYRIYNGIDHRAVRMAVVVQQMVFADAAGIMFTADPVTGNRRVVSIDASYGLGEALVSGLVNADVYKVRDNAVVERTIATKQLAVVATPEGGAHQRTIDVALQTQPTLTNEHAIRLAQLGRAIEAHFGRPQDIEWCLAGDVFHIVQSRPITTLFPVPENSDGGYHVYLSVGHQQMMTDAITPLGLSVWNLATAHPMSEAGGRLFVDVAKALASPAGRAGLLGLAGKSDPLTGDALKTIIARDFIPLVPADVMAGAQAGAPAAPIETDPAIVAELIARNEASIARVKADIRGKTGTELFDFILADIQELKTLLFDPQSYKVIMAGMDAQWWLNDNLEGWLGEKNAAFTLTQSVPGNVTSEMGLALMDVADVIRPHADVVAYLQRIDGDDFLDALPTLAGGVESRDAILGWLDTYGMRGAGEIDIARARWSERPSMLLPILLSNIRNFASGAGAQRFAQGMEDATRKEHELLARLCALPNGSERAEETKRMIYRVRTFAGYREYPKYAKIRREFVYKHALMQEAERLVEANVLRTKEDIFYLRFHELREAVRTHRVDTALIEQRKEAFAFHQTLAPPRVMTSEGESITGSYHRDDLPEGALVGLAVSPGTIEGRARVIFDIAQADFEPGDILVTAFTDPSWTPLFVAVKGLVTEVGGLMTHGAVIAREYGLPAVVSVASATRLIKDGQRIRVRGTDGYVEILPDRE